jgi:serine/threonine protein kinase
MKELIGQVLDEKYSIEKQLGQGGMGAVYLATHLGTKRPVALKVITPQFMTNEEFVERFKREAEATGRLLHPNVVNVTDFGFASVSESRVAYLVMEYLNGCTLGDKLKDKQPLPLQFVIDIVEQVCLAIDEAHKQGIIHRDLKPDNIWLEPNGRGGYNVKVLDFGLAKLRQSNSSVPTGEESPARTVAAVSYAAVAPVSPVIPDIDTESATHIQPAEIADETDTIAQNMTVDGQSPDTVGMAGLTRVGSVLGTPLYMSPEQCTGSTLDARSDIYSLGVIVYQMLAGETPFNGNILSLIVQHTQTPPIPLKEKNGEIPAAMAEMVMSALAKNRDERPSSAGIFASALRATAEDENYILRQSKVYYSNSMSVFLRLSLIVYLPFILLTVLISISATLLKAWDYWFFTPGIGLLLLLLILFANRLNSAACMLVIKQFRAAPQSSIQLRQILATLKRRLPALLSTTLRSHSMILFNLVKFFKPGLRSYVDNSLLASVVIMEDLEGEAVLVRSRELVSRLRSIAGSLQVRDFGASFFSLIFMPFSFSVGILLSGSSYIALSSLPLPLQIYCTLSCWLFIFFSHSTYIGIPLALLYFKARQANCEMLDDAFTQDPQQEEKPKRKRMVNTINILWLGVPILMLLLLILYARTGNTGLFYKALREGNYKTIKQLLDSGTDPNARGPVGTTPLMMASKDGYIELVKSLLAAGANTSLKDYDGDTALHYAALAGRIDSMRLLLDAGADVNIINKKGKTPLMYASSRGRIEVVKALLAAGADTKVRSSERKTALIYAEQEGYTEVEQILKAAAASE